MVDGVTGVVVVTSGAAVGTTGGATVEVIVVAKGGLEVTGLTKGLGFVTGEIVGNTVSGAFSEPTRLIISGVENKAGTSVSGTGCGLRCSFFTCFFATVKKSNSN